MLSLEGIALVSLIVLAAGQFEIIRTLGKIHQTLIDRRASSSVEDE